MINKSYQMLILDMLHETISLKMLIYDFDTLKINFIQSLFNIKLVHFDYIRCNVCERDIKIQFVVKARGIVF